MLTIWKRKQIENSLQFAGINLIISRWKNRNLARMFKADFCVLFTAKKFSLYPKTRNERTLPKTLQVKFRMKSTRSRFHLPWGCDKEASDCQLFPLFSTLLYFSRWGGGEGSSIVFVLKEVLTQRVHLFGLLHWPRGPWAHVLEILVQATECFLATLIQRKPNLCTFDIEISVAKDCSQVFV